MTTDEDVVVRDRVRQEVVREFGCGFDPDLRTAEMLLILASLKLYIHRHHPEHVVAQFDERVITRRQITMNSHPYSGLEMGGELMRLGHAERQGTMRKKHRTIVIDAGRIDLETQFAGELLADHHRQQRRHISFARGRDTFVVEFGEGYTAGIPDGGEQIKTP